MSPCSTTDRIRLTARGVQNRLPNCAQASKSVHPWREGSGLDGKNLSLLWLQKPLYVGTDLDARFIGVPSPKLAGWSAEKGFRRMWGILSFG